MQSSQASYAPIRRLLALAATHALARAQDHRIPHNDVPEYNERNHDNNTAVTDTFVGIIPIVRRIFFVYACGIALLTSSATIYGLFYLAVMPSHQVAETLFFDYTGLANHPAPVCVDGDFGEESALSSPYRPSPEQLRAAPWAAVDLFAKHTSWEALESVVVPAPVVKGAHGLLKAGKSHYIEVALALPESEINLMTGMFGVYVELQSSNGTRLALSSRTARLPHESRVVALIRKVFLLIPLLIGALQETKTVVVPSFRHLVESSEQPLRYLTVRLIMPSRLAIHEYEPLEVVSGEIRIGEELSEFQELLKVWFFTCFAFGISILCSVQLVAWFVVRLWRKRRHQYELNEEPPCELDLNGSQLGDDFLEGDGQWETLSNRSLPPNDSQEAENSVQGPDFLANSSASRDAPLPSVARDTDNCESEPLLDMTDLIPEGLSMSNLSFEARTGPDNGFSNSPRTSLHITELDFPAASCHDESTMHPSSHTNMTDRHVSESLVYTELNETDTGTTLHEAENPSFENSFEVTDTYNEWLESHQSQSSTVNERSQQLDDESTDRYIPPDSSPEALEGTNFKSSVDLSNENETSQSHSYAENGGSSPLSTQDSYELWLAKQMQQRDKDISKLDIGAETMWGSSANYNEHVDEAITEGHTETQHGYNSASLLEQRHHDTASSCPSACLVQ